MTVDDMTTCGVIRLNPQLAGQVRSFINNIELAAKAEVSERTLQTAFKEYFGVGPVRYLQLSRLRQINIALRASQSDGQTVAEILSRHGEWQFGRFAERYRRLFGESPSQTLQGH